jgi:hypothetical protein
LLLPGSRYKVRGNRKVLLGEWRGGQATEDWGVGPSLIGRLAYAHR